MLGSMATRSPGLKRVTALPMDSMIPENSCPGMMGYSPMYSPQRMWMSVPHIPEAITLISTSFSAGVGVGVSMISILLGSFI